MVPLLHLPHRTRDRVIVVGGGVAGLATALELAPLPVTVLVPTRAGTDAATAWAQGGIAAAIGEDDAPALHAADTLAAGAGLSDAEVTRRITEAAPACIERLIGWGVDFDRESAAPAGGPEGRGRLDRLERLPRLERLALGLEAAHSRRRIVHARGDGTGRAVIDALLIAARRTPSIEILEDARAFDLAVEDGAVVGVHALMGGQRIYLPARAVVLATGGIGGIYERTTNPLVAIGSGLALAARVGALLRDVEFVQFHPTAIATGADPMPLATEALRGEGAFLVNGRGERFMADVPGKELAPRDVVARAIEAQIARGEPVYLDTRDALGAGIVTRFPAVASLCRSGGIDPVTQPIPVRPAAHYHMGGVAVDARGRSTVDGLWACGEVASTGLHGANRLASNSLLEALAYARWIARDIAAATTARAFSGVSAGSAAAASATAASTMVLPQTGDAGAALALRRLMTRDVGVIRSDESLRRAIIALDEAAHARPQTAVSEMALVGLMVATAALQRHESRGAQYRADFPSPAAESEHTELTLADVRRRAADVRGESPAAGPGQDMGRARARGA